METTAIEIKSPQTALGAKILTPSRETKDYPQPLRDLDIILAFEKKSRGRNKDFWKWKRGLIREAEYQMQYAYIHDILSASQWDLWITLTVRDWISEKTMWKRFYWWIHRCERIVKHRLDWFFVCAIQKRGVVHLHGVIGNIPEATNIKDRSLRCQLKLLWDIYWGKVNKSMREYLYNDILNDMVNYKIMGYTSEQIERYLFGYSKIFVYNNNYAGRLNKYITKELIKNYYYNNNDNNNKLRLSWKIKKIIYKNIYKNIYKKILTPSGEAKGCPRDLGA